MLLYRHLYDVNAVDYSGPLNASEVFTAAYDDLIDTVTSVGAYAELIHIYAISAALGVVIQSYYPPVNGVRSSPYSRTVCGRGVRATMSTAFVLMWSMFTRPTDSERFHPNHFILLVDRNMTPEPDSISDVSDVDVAVTDAVFQHTDGGEHAVVADNSDVEQDSSDSDTSSVQFDATLPPATDEDDPVADSSSPVANFTPLPDGDWLPTATIVTLLRECTPEMMHDSVPNSHHPYSQISPLA